MELIPAMDLLGGRVVRLHKGDYERVTVYSTEPRAVLESYRAQGASRVHIVDLDGAREGRAAQAERITELVRAFGDSLRVQVGGGVRDLDRVKRWRDCGAERVVLGTRAVESPDFVAEAAEVLPVVVALDAREGVVSTHGWLRDSGLRAVDLARTLTARGASGVLYTDIARDGTGEGPNVEATAELAEAVPGRFVLASGGVGTLEHLRRLAGRPAIAGVIVGRALYEGSFTVSEGIAALAAATGGGA